jgi:hypothetical protein
MNPEFEPLEWPRWRVLAEVLAMREEAVESGEYAACVEGEPVIYLPYTETVTEGHICSEAGREEYKATRMCEWHFNFWLNS